MKRALLWLLAMFVAIQLVPYGHSHANPAVVAEPPWDAPETRALAVRACFDCHSNQTRWPFYAYVAPVSWLLESDVEGGRRHLNFSEWNRPQQHAGDAAAIVSEGDMPLRKYLLLHPAARLTDAERNRLVEGLTKMFGSGGR